MYNSLSEARVETRVQNAQNKTLITKIQVFTSGFFCTRKICNNMNHFTRNIRFNNNHDIIHVKRNFNLLLNHFLKKRKRIPLIRFSNYVVTFANCLMSN